MTSAADNAPGADAPEMVLYERRGAVALITYNRVDKRNAWSVPMYREVVRRVEQANADAEVGAIVITNNGTVYCAGADFKAPPEPKDPVTGRSPNVGSVSMAQDNSWLHLLAKSKPNIIAVQGAAIGLGTTQILAADMRIGGESSTYSFPFLKLGVMPELGCSALLPRLVGFGRALDLCLRSSKIDAAEAYRIGLITQVVPDAELVDVAVALAAEMARYPAMQVRLTKGMFYANATESDMNRMLATETQAFVDMMRGLKAAKAGASSPADNIARTGKA
jgi:enoyl-CoA hydratase/carnithine racemase